MTFQHGMWLVDRQETDKIDLYLSFKVVKLLDSVSVIFYAVDADFLETTVVNFIHIASFIILYAAQSASQGK